MNAYKITVTDLEAEDITRQMLKESFLLLYRLAGKDRVDPEDEKYLEALRLAHNYFEVEENWL